MGLAVGLAGREGAVGLQFALGLGLGAGHFTLQVQSSGAAFRADGAALQRLSDRRQGMLRTFAGYLWGFSQEVAELAASAQVLGVRRAGITQAAKSLKDMGLVDYPRGRIQILDLAGLAATAHAQQGASNGLSGGKELV